MFEINVTVNAPELAEALNNLAAALKGVKTSEADRPSVAPVPTAGPTSAAPSNTPAPVVPVTGAPAYTLDQISRAGASLVDAVKMQPLL